MVSVDPDTDTLSWVSSLAAADSRPTLTDGEVRVAVKRHPLPDRDGLPADHPDWTPTWDANKAASVLWGIKAGKVAGDFNFRADGSGFDKGEVIAHCLAMEAKFASQVGGSFDTAASRAVEYPGDLDSLIVNG